MNLHIDLQENKNIAEDIYSAEIDVDYYGGSIGTTLYGLAEASRKLEPSHIEYSQKLKSIAKKIIKGEPKERIYKQYLDQEILYILKSATEDEAITSGAIIKEYVPIKKLADNIRKKIKSKLYVPVFISLIGIFMMWYVVGEFIAITKEGTISGNFEMVRLVGEYYLLIGLSILGAIAIPLVFFPHKIPKIKAVFIKADAMLAILIIKMLNEIGQSPIKIIPFLQETFKLKTPIPNKNMEGLAILLYRSKYIKKTTAARMMQLQSIKKDFPEILDRTLFEIKQDLELSADIINDAVSNIATVLIVLPILPALWVMGTIIKAIFIQAGVV